MIILGIIVIIALLIVIIINQHDIDVRLITYHDEYKRKNHEKYEYEHPIFDRGIINIIISDCTIFVREIKHNIKSKRKELK